MERLSQPLGATPSKDIEVDETISQDHTDNSKIDPLTRADDTESSSSDSDGSFDERQQNYVDQSLASQQPQQQAARGPPIPYVPATSPSTISRKSSGSVLDVLEGEIQGSESVGFEYETLREAMKSISGLEFYQDRDYCRVVDFLLATIAKLKVENTTLKKEINDITVSKVPLQRSDIGKDGQAINIAQTITSDTISAPRYEVFHQVNCCHPPSPSTVFNHFRDAPKLFKGDTTKDHLRGQIQIPDIAEHFEEHKDVAFIINNIYMCGQSNIRLGIRNGRLISDCTPTKSTATNIAIRLSLLSAIKTTMNHHPAHFEGFDSARMPAMFYEPFLFFYIHSKSLVHLSESSGLEACDLGAIRLLCSYFEENWRGDWDEADSLFSRGKVNRKHVAKLFRPGEVILTRSNDGQEIITAKQVDDYPWLKQSDTDVEVLHWQFNGQFQKIKETITAGEMMKGSTLSQFQLASRVIKRTVVDNARIDDTIEKDITSLRVYPLRFSHDPALIEDQLVSRGLKFWKYRKQTLVCYMDPKLHEQNQAESRFMIDYEVFQRMHPRNETFKIIMDDLGQEIMDRDQPPSSAFLACLPAYIHGYDLSEKTWKLIRVDWTTDVTWNKSIFKRLVLPSHDKELIQAVITVHGQQMTGTADIVGGKGQGVLLLLHGSPGTGKTLTAEGIAEEQERPLYRVTCGDIGVEPEDVERYLKYVLEIGRAWGCVVLLDEADVFLEERSPADHKRNAVISIFLRVLEYYDGILILTTNRVGRFDEAFKSRIHLSLGYPNLNEEQREQIWRNFFQLLDRKKERFDIQDLELNIQKLAKHEINGRQIRNTVMMARHLAKFRKQALVYKHVQEAVTAVVKFNEYLQSVKGASDDDFAELDRLRARIT